MLIRGQVWAKCGHEKSGRIARIDESLRALELPPKSRLVDVPRESRVARYRRENAEWAAKNGPVVVRRIGEEKAQ
ncbi:hypothetical protein C8E05_3807 [Rhodococcus wratislaviensis]|uniref:Uncharacterized protein n=1 Tax=Rhodococcus wratislaviensis TaxID=44752 RepID=A0AB38FKR0_RHOWR|nr:hypothetical protein [Rhodococcus wratislaviensis]REE74372.1 hypothetical protein C8E05_3807 [Rhodococcus wratislaviensis]SPZ42091.1 Uncharacterised protein [Rhodococcus wratislaviensis]